MVAALSAASIGLAKPKTTPSAAKLGRASERYAGSP
jgi:hypothetical protein